MNQKALISLTPSESKKLIGMAVAKHQYVRKAFKNGIIVIHPSTTTYYLFKELVEKEPPKPIVCGVVTRKGLCISEDGHNMLMNSKYHVKGAGNFYPWVIKKGSFVLGITLKEVLNEMRNGDVYIKTGNAIDPNYNVGVLFGGPEGGTIGLALKYSKEKGFKILVPIGLEKTIPIHINDAKKITSFDRKYFYSMGMPCGLLKIDGEVVTEIDAIKLLTGAEAHPIASGGIVGGEGSIVIIAKGDESQIKELINILKKVKGTELPDIKIKDCETCQWITCPWRRSGPDM